MAITLKTAETDDIRRAVLAGGNILYAGLTQYSVAVNPRTGRPLFYPGGFCMGVKLTKSGTPAKCLRCWWREISGEADVLGRMRKTAEAIKRRSSAVGQYFINYEVVDNLLRVDGDIIPGVVMDWVDGEVLNRYLANTTHTSSDIRRLAANFKKMCSILSANGIAHGDLSGPNIMVRNNQPVLVDYDTMYFKEDGRRTKTIDGTPPYQHPGRGSHPYMELCCDNFAHHVIYATLLILAEIPDARHDVDPREKLYFDKEDMLSASEFESSHNTKRARALGNTEINKELDVIGKALRGRYLDVPPLTDNYVPKSWSTWTAAAFCTVCGHKFTAMESDFIFCTACGARRLIYTS